MSLIDSNDRFAVNPTRLSKIQRSKFDMSHTVKTTFNVGELVPFDVMEVLPGDTFNVETNTLTRLQTLITPMMDDLYLDTYYFFVPNRLVWDHWKEFNGENTKSAWYPTTTYTIPNITINRNDNLDRSILDYMGIPTNTDKSGSASIAMSINALPVRAYNLIWNEWFRDENVQDPILVPTDDATYAYDKDTSYKGGSLLKVNKYHDYFTSALPTPQKGPDVSLPLVNGGLFPVAPIHGRQVSDYFDITSANFLEFSLTPNPDGSESYISANNHPIFMNSQSQTASKKGQAIVDKDAQAVGTGDHQIYPSNLFAFANTANVATINQLRLAFATQQLYELDARGGTRYVEILKSHFGVTSPDARQQRPELLSYNHQPINVNQVVQQSGTVADSALGDVAGLSVTADSDNSFVKSFTEHGYVIGLCCARYKHSYQQGLNRMWSRKTRFDFYWPVFANIGEQPILNKEIYLDYTKDDSDSSVNNEVFGYQEAWAEYRYVPDRVSAEMRSDYPTSLDVWHLADDYDSLPKLSADWMKEDATTVNRVLAVSDDLSAQLFMDIYLKMEATRPMPMYSIPGLTRM